MISKPSGKFKLCILLSVTSTSLNANVLGLFPAGASCKSAAIESAGDCSEAQTLLYNPAVMSDIDSGFTGEIGVGRLQYSYEHPSFDPVHVNLISPIFSEGWRGTLLENRLSWGFAVAPASSADLNIKGLPRRTSTTTIPEPLNVKAQRRLFHLPLGGSYSLPEYNLSLGAAVIYTYDKRSLQAASVTSPDASLISLKGEGHFFRPILGARHHFGILSSGVSYMFPLTKHFKGKTKLAAVNEPFNTELVDYDPGVLLSNFQANLGSIIASTNINHIFAAKGRNIIRDGVNRKTTQSDLNDANQFGARIGYKTGSSGTFSFAMAHLYSMWGDGHFYIDEDGFGHQELGQAFGQFNAIPVRNQAISWQKAFSEWQTNFSAYRTAGTTTAGPGGDNPGFYQVEFVSLSCSVRRVL